jgi:uncharacterized protein YggE
MQTATTKQGMLPTILIIGMVLLAGIIISSILRDRFVNQPYREVSITGTGKVAYTPDIAKVTLGVHAEKPTAQAALDEMSAVIGRVIPAVEALGISRDKISTQNLSVYPQYYYPEGAPSQINSYTADQQLIIEIAMASSSPDLVGKVIQAASGAGANQVQSVTFDVSNLEDLRQEATIAALADARSRAKTLADAAGVRLGKVHGWWANPISVPGQPMPYYDSYGRGGDMALQEDGMNVPSGTSEIIMEVNLNYGVK